MCDFIPLMMGAVGSSETSVNFYQNTARDIPEDNSFSYSQPIPVAARSKA
jgi:hypothetical protein